MNNGGRTDQNAPYQMNSQPRQILGQSCNHCIHESPATRSLRMLAPSISHRRRTSRTPRRSIFVPAAEYKGLDIQMTPVRRFTVCGTVRGIPPRQSRVQNNPGGPIPPPPPPRPSAGGASLPPIPNTPNPNDPCGFGTTVIQDPVGTVQLAPLDVELRPALNCVGKSIQRDSGWRDGTVRDSQRSSRFVQSRNVHQQYGCGNHRRCPQPRCGECHDLTFPPAFHCRLR